MAPPQQLNGIWLVVTVDCAVVNEPLTGVIVAGDGLVAQVAGAVASSGLVLAERWSDMTGMGSRGRVHPQKTPPHPPARQSLQHPTSR